MQDPAPSAGAGIPALRPAPVRKVPATPGLGIAPVAESGATSVEEHANHPRRPDRGIAIWYRGPPDTGARS